MKPTIFVFTPSLVANDKHVAMIRTQTLVKSCLQRVLPGFSIVSGLLMDKYEESLLPEIQGIASSFDVYSSSIPTQFGIEWGIRKGTQLGIDIATNMGARYVMRIIQDTFVESFWGLAACIERSTKVEDLWMGANVHDWHTSAHGQFTEEMGLPFNPVCTYPNGALMLAPLEVWRKYYLGLPSRINHYFDDVMMGQWMLHEGVRLDPWPTLWKHCHDCDPKVSSEFYTAHLKQV